MNILAIPQRDHAFLRVHGTEADSFLQGQLSSDLRLLTPERAQISSYNTAKGRILALPQLLRDADGSVLMELPAPLLAPTLKRLRLFVLRAKVTLEAPGETLQALGLIGEDAPAWLASQNLPAPAEPLACAAVPARALLVLRRLGERPRYSLIGPATALQPLREALARDAREGHADDWRRADIEGGVPVVLPQTQELFIPQMLNLDLLGGIGFEKGCYTGQEIVARLHYLGQVKRRMFEVRISGPAPAPGSAIITDTDQAAGEIVDAVDAGDGTALASAVLQLTQRDRPLRLKEGGHPMMVIRGPET